MTTLDAMQFFILGGAAGVLLGTFIGFHRGYTEGFKDAAGECQKILDEEGLDVESLREAGL